MRRADRVFETVIQLCGKQLRERGRVSGVTALEIARDLNLYRSNVSADLNKLVRSGKLEKVKASQHSTNPLETRRDRLLIVGRRKKPFKIRWKGRRFLIA